MVQREQNGVLFVTGIHVAIDEENQIILAGIISESPFSQDEQEFSDRSVVNFAFTRQQATFLRDRLDAFLKEGT